MVYSVKFVWLQTTAYLKWNSRKCFDRDLTKVLFAALKDKKALRRYKEKSVFQTIAIELDKQPRKKRKTEKRTLKISNRFY